MKRSLQLPGCCLIRDWFGTSLLTIMGLKEDIAAIRSDIGKHSQGFFVFFFKKYPRHMRLFPDYEGRTPDSLKGNPKFASHTQKVVTLLLEVAERSSDPANFKADAEKLVKMPQHANLSTDQFDNLFTALVMYLGNTFGASCDRDAWETLGKDLVIALDAAGM